MPSPFAAALVEAEAVLDQHLGESVTVIPMVASDFGRTVDGIRPAFDAVALVTVQDPSSANAEGMEVRVAYDEVTVEIRRALLPAYRLAKNDEILLLERPGSPRVKVNRIERLDEERIVLVCGPVADLPHAG